MKTNHTREIPGPGRLGKLATPARIAIAILTSFLVVPFCAGQGSSDSGQAAEPGKKIKVIYVNDFALDPGSFKPDKGGLTGKGYLLPAPRKSFLRRERQDPQIAAGNLVSLMSESLVRDLEKRGFTARRLSTGALRPTDGLLVSGVFTELNEGNQARRALLGFGSGTAKVELYVTVADASSGPRVYETWSQTSSGKKPGSVIAVNPYAGSAAFVAKFAMTKNAPEKMIKKSAAKIASQIASHLSSTL